jgi:hypothetical protein
MKKTPKNKKSESRVSVKYKIIELPSDNRDMERYVVSNRAEINEKILDIIEYAVKNKLGGVEIFCFKNSSFVVVLNRKDFKETLQNIYDFNVEHEKFETCVRIKTLIDLVNRFGFVFKIKKSKK